MVGSQNRQENAPMTAMRAVPDGKKGKLWLTVADEAKV